MLAALVVMALAGAAQQIAVVTSGGSTTVHTTLKEAIEHATNGCVIYLPGGTVSIGDSVKITKRVTIVGIGHKNNPEKEDGSSIINGNLWFNQGSSGSALMGVYLSGSVVIGEDGIVNNVLVRLCNVYGVQVRNAEITGTMINQNYIRQDCNLGNCDGTTITNNIMEAIGYMRGGIIKNNILQGGISGYTCVLFDVDNTQIEGNVINTNYSAGNCDNCVANRNLSMRGCGVIGNNPIKINAPASEVFINPAGITPVSNYHFKDEYKQYESQVGVYAGSGFSDGALPPVPYIVAKRIADQTDAAGTPKVSKKR